MKQFEITNFVTAYNDLGNFFNVYQDDKGNYYFNILKTVNFLNSDNIAPGFYTKYIVKEHDTWTIIAYNSYGDITLWWLICKFNGIMDPMDMPVPGIALKIPTVELMKAIVDQMRSST